MQNVADSLVNKHFSKLSSSDQGKASPLVFPLEHFNVIHWPITLCEFLFVVICKSSQKCISLFGHRSTVGIRFPLMCYRGHCLAFLLLVGMLFWLSCLTWGLWCKG